MSDNEDKSVNLDAVLKRVRKLIEMAEATIAPNATADERAQTMKEQQRAREMADALMLKYAVDEAMAESNRPVTDRAKPMIITVEIGNFDNDIIEYIASLCGSIAKHCRCMVRSYAVYDSRTGVYSSKIYGFESDVRYFEFLYTTLRLHMLGVLLPKMDPQLTMEENCYRLHNAGYNWLEIAAMEGWRKYDGQQGVAGHLAKYYNQKLDTVETAGKIGSSYKRAYQRACALRGEVPKIIAAGATRTYRKSAAWGYASRLDQRLRAVANSRETASSGSDLVLRSRFEDLEEMFKADNPDMFVKVNTETKPGKKVRMRKYVEQKFNADGYGQGVSHANTADLGTGVGGAAKREIG